MRRFWPLCLALAFAVAVASVAYLSVDVVRKTEALATSRSDNVQWTLSQAEVDAIQLENAILRRDVAAGSDLDQVRRRFDILYSRIAILRSSGVFEEIRKTPAFGTPLREAQDFLDRNVVYIDQSDAALASALPRMEEELREVLPRIRDMSLAGLGEMARRSDAERISVFATMVKLGALSLGLFVFLLVALAALMVVIRQLQHRTAAVRATSARLRAMVSTSLDAIVVADRRGTVIDFNGAAESIFGFTRDEAVGRNLTALIVPEKYRAAHLAGMERYRRAGARSVVGQGRLQLEAMRKSGEVFPVEISVGAVDGEFGEIFVSYLRDISSRLEVERNLIAARDDALSGEKAKADFLAVMSHEMRTPLNGLLGTMELLGRTELSGHQREYLGMMSVSGATLLHHVNEVLDISRLDSGLAAASQIDFNAKDLLEEVAAGLDSMARGAGNTIITSCGAGAFDCVRGDPRRLRQILLNLVGNAIAYTHGGTISVELERLNGSDEAELRVTDTGIGIPEDDLERVFEDFVTLDATFGRRTGGTGLGLAITRRIVSALGGSIGVESEVGEGSLFWVRLPLPRADGTKAVAPDAAPPVFDEDGPGRGYSVLVVEDNPINRRITREMLEVLGARVSEACDGLEGVAMAESSGFDLILMDISMPRMDGLGATRAIRAGGGPSARSPIFALTAHALPDDIARFREAGMAAALTKPLSIAALSELFADTETNTQTDTGPEAVEQTYAGVLDACVIDELTEHLGCARVEETLAEFVAMAATEMAWLTSSETKTAAFPELSARAHSLAGAAGLVGARQLHQALATAERAGRASDRAGFSAAIARADRVWSETRQALTHRLGKAAERMP